MMHRLTFDELQRACVERDKTYRNARGELNDCADWSESDWLSAMIGEIGEACNILKKVRRGDLTLDEARDAIGEEMGDAQTYLVKWCSKLNIDLGQVTFDKFNKVSRKVGSPTMLPLAPEMVTVNLTINAPDAQAFVGRRELPRPRCVSCGSHGIYHWHWCNTDAGTKLPPGSNPDRPDRL